MRPELRALRRAGAYPGYERALDGELFLVDVEKRNFVGRFHLRHAEEQDRRAASCKLEGAFHSGVVARALNDDVCAVAADEREEFFVIAVFERVNAQIRAELLCNLGGALRSARSKRP